MDRVWLWVEFVVLFVGLPLGYRYSPRPLPALPVLWLAAGYCWWQMRRNAAFQPAELWNVQALPGQMGSILLCFAVGAGLIGLGVWRFAPELAFGLVRHRPVLWAAVMVLYPVLSVVPQGLIYRVFLMHRYSGLVPSHWGMIVVSALAFAWLHLIFRNGLAVGLTFVGGLLFAWRYEVTGSLMTSAFEHALYGSWLFTVGLGQYFYHGRVRLE